ncbi:MAG: hypothetical protein LBV50_00905 [Novosphingobium sp.]|jgi:hypothetical protein|nr:hypothetical protein [Novosphingobium sp.]
MGGDDRGWLLKEVVCGICNTEVFSPLEAKVMRASPLSIARLFLQTRTRKRGKKTSAPSIRAPISYFDDPQSGLLLEQELGGSGQSRVWPQVNFVPPERMIVSATNVASANELRRNLEALADLLTVCEKTREGLEVRYRLTPLRWDGLAYEVGESDGVAAPPRDAIWLEPLEYPKTETAGTLTARVFRRAKGPITCRADCVGDVASLLTLIRHNHAKLVVPAGTTSISTETPSIHLRQAIDPVAYNRVLVKIAVNVCAHLFGDEAVRTPAFARAREYARYGTGSVVQLPIEHAKRITATFPPLPHHHLLLVYAKAPSAGEPGHVMINMQFYGGIVHSYLIAVGDSVPTSAEPIFVVVDFEANSIEGHSPDGFAQFAGSIGALWRDTAFDPDS